MTVCSHEITMKLLLQPLSWATLVQTCPPVLGLSDRFHPPLLQLPSFFGGGARQKPRWASRHSERALAGPRFWSCRVEGSWLKSPPAGAWTLLLGSNSGFLLLSRNDPVICQICFHSEHQIIKSGQVAGAVSPASPWRPRARPSSCRTRSESKRARSGLTGRGCLVQVLS